MFYFQFYLKHRHVVLWLPVSCDVCAELFKNVSLQIYRAH